MVSRRLCYSLQVKVFLSLSERGSRQTGPIDGSREPGKREALISFPNESRRDGPQQEEEEEEEKFFRFI
jgi:hypothetical protein